MHPDSRQSWNCPKRAIVCGELVAGKVAASKLRVVEACSGEAVINLQLEEVAQVPSDAWWSLPELPPERVRHVAREAQEALLLIHSDESSFNAIDHRC